MIYEINGDEQFVFKSSSTTTMKMSAGSANFLTEEYCHFDGNHKRVIGFVTLTASMYQLFLKKYACYDAMRTRKREVYWYILATI